MKTQTDLTRRQAGWRLGCLACFLLLTTAGAGRAEVRFPDGFVLGDGVLTPLLTPATVDQGASYALPGHVALHLGVARLQNVPGQVWESAPVAQKSRAFFMVVFKQPLPVGTILALTSGQISYLRPGVQPDPEQEDRWITVPYPGDPGQRLRVLPLPPGTVTGALRVTLETSPNPQGKFSAGLTLLTCFAARLVNVGPLAQVSVSSSAGSDQGFRPEGHLNEPANLVDGLLPVRSWASGPRATPVSPEQPEWIVLDWGAPRSLRGCALFMGAHESGCGRVQVQRFTGTGTPNGADNAQWETVKELSAFRPWRLPLWEVYGDFGRPVQTSALRLLTTAGLPAAQAAGGEGASPNAISLGEVMAFEDLGDQPAPARLVKAPAFPAGVVPLNFTLPGPGLVTIQILNERNEVVRNLIGGESFPAGASTVWWDLSTLADYWPPFRNPGGAFEPPADWPRLAAPGRYHWRGLYHPPLNLHYLYDFNPIKPSGLPWITQDTTGGWLADHVPPQTIVRTGDTMWVGTFCEGGHALLEADGDMKKLWGSSRIWLACPRVLAADGDNVYFAEQGGWTGKRIVMIQVNRQTKASRRILVHDYKEGDQYQTTAVAPGEGGKPEWDVQGLAVVGDRAYLGNRAKNVILVLDLSRNLAGPARGFGWDAVGKAFDDEKMVVLKEIALDRPGRIRPYDATHLAAVSGTSVVLINRETYEIVPVVTGLTNPLGLGVDDQASFYVGEMDPVHQVKVFSRDGKLVRTIGKPGKHQIGAFDKDNLESPADVAVDARGSVWVCEFSDELKRTSVWDAQGHCVNQVLGPPQYGGGGEVDPADENHFFYRGQEFRRDPRTGAVRLLNLTWRADDKTYPSWGSYPSYPFRRGGKLYFTSWQGWATAGTIALWLYDRDHVRPVAAFGASGDKQAPVFAWTDLNDNGKVDQGELKQGPLTYDGKPWDTLGAVWQCRMNENFEAAMTDGKYNSAGIAFFRVERLTPQGYPVYRLPDSFFLLPGLGHSCDAVYTDRQGNAVAMFEYLLSMKPDGTVNWRYPNRWPGLHAGHSTTASGDEPGVLIAPCRFWGSAVVNDEVGEVLSLNSNLGATYLFTADGLYLDRVFQDIRRGLTWLYDAPPSDDIVNASSTGDEHFGGTFQKVVGADGKAHFRYVVSPGSPHCSVIELQGLERVKRLPGASFEVTGPQFQQAERLAQQRALAQQLPHSYTISRVANFTLDAKPDEFPAERADGFALGYDDQNLYVYYEGRDDRAVFQNAARQESFVEAFKTGDAVDVMLQTKAGLDPRRDNAGEGDLRLSFAVVAGQPAAILYDFVVPGTAAAARLAFSSPWRTLYVDRVSLLPEAKITVVRRGDSFSLEAAVPLASLHLQPRVTASIRGDVGRVLSDQTGTRAVDRVYWSNSNTHIVSDLPSEARLQPNLWGTFTFRTP